MVTTLDSGLTSPGSKPCQGLFIVFLGKTLYSHSTSFLAGQVQHLIEYRRISPSDGPTLFQGGGRLKILLLASCYGNVIKADFKIISQNNYTISIVLNKGDIFFTVCNILNITGWMSKCTTDCCEGDNCNAAVRISGLVASFVTVLLALFLNLFPEVQ